MDDRIYDFYRLELHHVRHMAAEFARAYPKMARRLTLPSDLNECEDPWVERLLEGFAYLAARVHLKLDAVFPRFTHSLLETVYPHYMAPTPSMAMVQFEPDPDDDSLAEGFEIPRDSILRGKGAQTKCEYRTKHDVTLWPVQVVEAEYHTRDLASLGVPPRCGAKAGIRVRLRSTAGLRFSQLRLDQLALHLHGADETPMWIYEQCFANGVGLLVQSITRPVKWQTLLESSCLRRLGFGEEEAMLPYDARSFQGYRLLREYFTLPERFLFVELNGLQRALQKCEADQIDVIILVGEQNLELENAVAAEHFRLFCAPAINLFPKRCDPISLSDRLVEHHVVPDRTRPTHFEVYQVKRVVGRGARATDEREFLPFYSASDLDAEGAGAGAYFVANRVPRTLTSKEAGGRRRSDYAGSEVYVMLVDAKAAPYHSDLRLLSVEALCTNRDLPIVHSDTEFTPDTSVSAPVVAIRSVGGRPRPPRASHVEGEFAWRAISHLALNYLSLADTDERKGAEALRDLLKLYADTGEAHILNQIEAIKSVQSRPVRRPVPTPGPIAFARGLEVAVTFDEHGFRGTGVFLLGAVLAEFFTRYVSINSFTETVVRTAQRGEVMRWPAQIGQRPIF